MNINGDIVDALDSLIDTLHKSKTDPALTFAVWHSFLNDSGWKWASHR